MPKIKDGSLNSISLQTALTIETVYKGAAQVHFLKPLSNNKGFILTATDQSGLHRTITTLENPNPIQDVNAGNRWAEATVSNLLESMYGIKTPYQEHKRREFIAKIKQIPIIEYASILGFTVVKRGSYYSTKEHDSMSIDANSNFYWQNSKLDSDGKTRRGSIIDFAINHDPELQNLSREAAKSKAISKLSKLINSDFSFTLNAHSSRKSTEPVQLIVPPVGDPKMQCVKAYLNKSRKIDKDIIQYFIDKKYLYEDDHRNCVFIGYDETGKVNFVNKRGTNTFKRFVQDVPGCDYEKGLYINNNSDKMIVVESSVEALSVMTILKLKGRNFLDFNYLILSGTEKYQATKRQLEIHPNITHAILALNNDDAGWTANRQIKDSLAEMIWPGQITDYVPKELDDWNDVLRKPFNQVVQLDNSDNPSPEGPKENHQTDRYIEREREWGR